MTEFDLRADYYRRMKQYRERARSERDPETRRQLLARADACERRARGFGTVKGKNQRGT